MSIWPNLVRPSQNIDKNQALQSQCFGLPLPLVTSFGLCLNIILTGIIMSIWPNLVRPGQNIDNYCSQLIIMTGRPNISCTTVHIYSCTTVQSIQLYYSTSIHLYFSTCIHSYYSIQLLGAVHISQDHILANSRIDIIIFKNLIIFPATYLDDIILGIASNIIKGNVAK